MKDLITNRPLFRILIPPFAGLLIYLLILLFYNDFFLFVSLFTSQELYIVIVITYLILETGRLVGVIINKHYTFRDYQYVSVAFQLSASLIITYLMVYSFISIYFKYALGFSISTTQLAVFLSVFLSFALLYQLFYYGLFFMQIKNERRLQEESEKNQDLLNATIRFKNEINPKMLYDSLETLIILSKKNPDEADDFINSLSEIYRYILSNKQSELVPLHKDVEMAEKMVGVLNHRYNNAVVFRSSISSKSIEIQLIPGTLPKLVERIVESSIINTSFPLIIQCDFDKDSGYIEISYKLNDKLVTDKNRIFEEVQRSYSFLSDKPLVHVKAYDLGHFKIPALQSQSIEDSL